MISDAIIRTITRWLPTLDEARLREVEDFVLAKAIEQQDSAPADTVVPHDGERTHGGNLSPAVRDSVEHHHDVVPRSSGVDRKPHEPQALSAAGRHGAQRDAATGAASSRARVPCETPTGGDSRGCSICGATFSCDCAAKVSPENWQCPTCDAPVGRPCWVEPLAGDSCTLRYHGARLHMAHLRANELRAMEAGLRELAAAAPVKAAAPGILLDFDMSDIGDDE